MESPAAFGFRLSGRNPILKVLLILALIVGLLLPLALIQGLVSERQGRQHEVVLEIGQLWGRAQTIAGPILVVPARRTLVDRQGNRTVEEDSLVLLPDDYDLRGQVVPETRQRGIFDAVVYRLQLDIAGTFVLPPDAAEGDPSLAVDWGNARLVLGLSDQRSVTDAPDLIWEGQDVAMTPGLPQAVSRLSNGGMQAAVPGLGATSLATPRTFSLSMAVNGSQSLAFLPLGRNTTAEIDSGWPHPSFFGSFLPESREISDEGFSARWATSYFARSYPQVWQVGDDSANRFAEIAQSGFGVRFFQPVDAYHQTERSAKYGVLFLVFTFAVLFLYEMLAGVRIHIFQYGLVGSSLALFYMLLLALAEQVGFGLAYAAGAAAVVGQIAFYTRAVLGSTRRTVLLAGLLAALYGGLYVLMRLEDFALLVGAVALFAGLTAIMAGTRRIDWYAIGLSGGDPREPPTGPEPPTTAHRDPALG